MDIRKEIPEEVKNQMIDGKKRVITVKLPEKLATKLEEKGKLKRKRLQRFVSVSLSVVSGQIEQQETLKLFKSIDDSNNDTLKRAFKKLGLRKKIGYSWRYDGKDSFIGVYNPPKPKGKGERPIAPKGKDNL